MKNSLFPILSISLFFLFLIVGCNSTTTSDSSRRVGEDVKNRNIKIYNVKIKNADPVQNCDVVPLDSLGVDINANTFFVSFCIRCEGTNGTLNNPSTKLEFINTPHSHINGYSPSPPLICNDSSSKYGKTYTAQFEGPIGNQPNNTMNLKFTAHTGSDSDPSDNSSLIDTTFSFSLYPAPQQ